MFAAVGARVARNMRGKVSCQPEIGPRRARMASTGPFLDPVTTLSSLDKHNGLQVKPLVIPLCAGVPTEQQLARFQIDGYLIMKSVIPAGFINEANTRIDKSFTGSFDTTSYPDEWYWRKEMSLPDVTRHMTNVWKADKHVARLVLCENLSRFASHLMSWSQGARIGNDSVWIKPPGKGTEVAFHSDLWYIPTKSAITCWVAMTDVEEDNGTLEYIPGSHNWPDMAAIPRDEFHVEGSHYRSTAYEFAKRAGLDAAEVKFEKAIAPAGSIVFHHGKMFHGSDKNRRTDIWRRSMGVHLIPSDSTHGSNDGYIYGRYKRFGESAMDETYFPITWTPKGYRSPVIKPFLLGQPY